MSDESRSAGGRGAADPQSVGLFQRAVSYHQAGNLKEASFLYRQILEAEPDHVDALHLLGLVALQEGWPEEAERRIAAAIARDPSPPYLHNNLGEARRALGNLEGAEECYRHAIEIDPGYAQAWNNLGLALHVQGRYAEAVDAFERSLGASAPAAEVHNNIGVSQEALGRLDDAIASFRRSIDADPSRAESRNNLGAALGRSGQTDEAIGELEAALRIDPALGRAHFNLARMHFDRGEADAAESACLRAIEIEPGAADYHVLLSMILRARGRLDESKQSLVRAVEAEPGHAVAHNDLGVSLLVEGRFEEAERSFRRALELDPGLAIAWENLSRTRRFSAADEEDLRRLEQRIEVDRDDPERRVHLEFALAKMLEDRGEHEAAFDRAGAANALKRASIDYDLDVLARFCEATERVVTADLIAANQHFGVADDSPIFIVGMPRSGTTLVEQILASHPAVAGGGEIEYFRQVAAALPAHLGAEAYPDCLAVLDEATVGQIASEYLLRLARDAGDASYVTDKMPVNFEHLGLIAMVFPGARIVHCERDPLDTCVSIWFQHFAAENEYAYDLDDIAAYYRAYRRLMSHWRRVLPGRIHDVRYEDLVRDQESVTRRLLDACGLPWDERCLRPHETRRPVGTASHWQVRQPVHAGAVERWRRYGDRLDALRAALAGVSDS